MKNKSWIFVICALILCAVCGGVVYFASTKKSGGEVFQESLQAMKDVKSATTTISAHVVAEEEGTEVKIDLPFTIAYGNDTLKLELGDNPFLGKASAYAVKNGQSLNVYFPSSLIDMMVGITSEESVWLTTQVNLDELKENVEPANTEELDYKTILGNDKFVYVDKEGEIDHYQLIVDDELLTRIAEATKEEVQKIGGTIKLDFYINHKTKYITKISADLKDVLSKVTAEETVDLSSIKECSFTIELKDMNTTTVTIPKEATDGAIDVNEYAPNIPDQDYDENYEDYE